MRIVQIKDLNKRRDAEMDKYLSHIVESLPDTVFVLDADHKFRKVFSEFGNEPLQIDQNEFIGKYYSDVLPTDLSKQISEAIEHIDKGEDGVTFEYELDDNEKLRWYSVALKKLDLEGTDGIEYLTFVRNITSRKKKERDLRAGKGRHFNIIEHDYDVFFRTDLEGVIREISNSIEKYSGYYRREVIGTHVSNYYYRPGDGVRVTKEIVNEGKICDLEIRLKTKLRNVLYVSLNAQIIFNVAGDPIGIEGYMQDISSRKSTEEKLAKLNMELQELNEKKDKIFSVIAHDLRTPVAGLVSMFKIIFDQFDSMEREELFGYLDLLRNSIHNTHELLEDLLLWSKSQFTDVKLNEEPVNLDLLIAKTFKQLHSRAVEKSITLSKEISGSQIIKADSYLLNTIIRNLVSNAIKFSHPNHPVVVKSWQNDSKVTIAVVDKGVGIKEEDKKKIFDKTSHYSTKGTQGERGSGLGLDLCRDLIESHGGKIWFESEYREGSTFYITIPMTDTGQISYCRVETPHIKVRKKPDDQIANGHTSNGSG